MMKSILFLSVLTGTATIQAVCIPIKGRGGAGSSKRQAEKPKTICIGKQIPLLDKIK
jgi:hypothetical protein